MESHTGGSQAQVFAWLRQHRALIVQAEQRFRVDRRAIAGVIAWESLMNARNSFPHLWDPGGMLLTVGVHGTPGRARPSLDRTLLHQIEDADWLPEKERVPKQTDENRATQLATLEGAVVYIAAAMNAASHLARRAGFPSIRKNPIPLTFFWQKMDLVTWRQYLDEKPKTTAFTPGLDPNRDIDAWVLQNNLFLTGAAGSPNFYETPGED